eukprot:jgi/Orpsp1_1/1184312/evm.model.c7180000089046.1
MRIKQRIIIIVLFIIFLITTFYFIKNNDINTTSYNIKNLKQFILNIEDYTSFTDNYCQANYPQIEEYTKP